MAEHPVKNCTRIASPHMAEPPSFPPALRKIWAAGRPVGVLRMPSKSVRQKHIDMVRIQPRMPDTITADWMARGPRAAALWVSSDMLGLCVSWSGEFSRYRVCSLCSSVVVGHCPCNRDKP